MASLRRTLLAWLLAPLVALISAGAALQYWLTVQPATEALDVALGDAALAVGNLLRADNGELRFRMTDETERLLRSDRYDILYFAVLAPGGALVAGDRALAALELAAPPVGQLRYEDTSLEGQPVRIASLGLDCGGAACQVRIAETLAKRHRIERDALGAAFATLALVVAGAAIAVAVGVRRGLLPLARVREEIGRRTLDDLGELDARGAPAEVQPLLNAINQLFARLQHAAGAQKAFVADAAHQLRTPLTALKTETELALLEPHPPQVAATLARIASAARRSARLAEQLLALARADSAAEAGEPPQALDLRDIAGECAQDWVPRAIEAGADLGFDLQAAPVMGRPWLLRELLGNLIHNALQYAGPTARITVRTGTDAGLALLEVEDNGPGIAPPERERVLGRFARGREAGGDGTGLGLAIVRDIARLHGGDVSLHAGQGGTGLRARVALPARAVSPS